MALKLTRYVSQVGRNFISAPKIRVPVACVRCISTVSADSCLFRQLKAPKPIFRNLAPPSFSLSSSSAPVDQDQQPPTKWEGKAEAVVSAGSADKVWALLSDYSSVYKYLPNIESSKVVDGTPGKLGCVRYCTGPPMPGSDSPTFTNEKLVAYDPEGRSLSYEVQDNNVGFGKFVATIKVVPESDGSCKLEWSFVSDPAPYWSPEKITGYIGFSVQGMAKLMEEALKA